jgi:hypothetical protein
MDEVLSEIIIGLNTPIRKRNEKIASGSHEVHVVRKAIIFCKKFDDH